MVIINKNVDRWLPIVNEVRGKIPAKLILAIIKNESGGRPGIIAGVKTKYAKSLNKRDGSKILVNKALGLMQVIPTNISHYNKNVSPVTYDDMTGNTNADAKKQIALGTYILKNNFTWLHKLNPTIFPFPIGNLTSNQLSFGLAAYAYGNKRVLDKINELRKLKMAIRWENLVKKWPNWGRPANNPIYYVSKIKKMMGEQSTDLNNTKKKSILPLLLIAISIIVMNKKRS